MSDTIEKIMSLTAAEFAAGLANVGGLEPVGAAGHAARLGTGSVSITFEQLPGATLGGLLVLPRAKVRLTFHAVDANSRAEFVRRFDFAFQRGGG